MIKSILMVMAVFSLVAATVQAEDVALYEFTGGSLASSDTNLATTASSYSTNAVGGTIQDNARAVSGADTAGSTATLTAALANGDYDEFSVSVDSDYSMSVYSVAFQQTGTNLGGTTVFKAYVLLDANGDGYDSGDFITPHAEIIADGTTNDMEISVGSTAVAGGTNISFRIYYADESTDATQRQFVDNVSVDAALVHLSGEVVANYDFESPTQLDSIDTNSATTASDYSTNGVGGVLWSTSRPVHGDITAGATLSEAFAAGDYDEFTVSVAAGNTMDLQSLVFDHTGVDTPDWVNFKAYVLIDADYNGFTTDDFLTHSQLLSDAGNVGFAINLASGDYEIDDVPGGTSIDFRIYYADGSGSSDRAHIMDNVVVRALFTELLPATILDFSPAGGDMMEMVVEVPSGAVAYEPRAATDLVASNWTTVAHSYTNDSATLQTTNLSYSVPDASGTNRVIYLQSTNSVEFFKIIAE